ncbi:hypothetical protein HGM15179_002309, partial [Zosterops borbonicus]
MHDHSIAGRPTENPTFKLLWFKIEHSVGHHQAISEYDPICKMVSLKSSFGADDEVVSYLQSLSSSGKLGLWDQIIVLSLCASPTSNFGFSNFGSIATPLARTVDISDNQIIPNVTTYLVKLAGEAWFVMEAKKEVLSYETPENSAQVAGIEGELLDDGTSSFCCSHSYESQCEQPQLSQPFLTGENLGFYDHFCIHPLDLVQQVLVFLMLGIPGLDTILQMGSQESRVEGEYQLPHPAGHVSVEADQETFDFLG